jgi:hypothetical protein
MRSAARLKMGYYPLPESEGKKLRALLSCANQASVIDPCVGQGTALQLVTSDVPVRRYGVELDAEPHTSQVPRASRPFRETPSTLLQGRNYSRSCT